MRTVKRWVEIGALLGMLVVASDVAFGAGPGDDWEPPPPSGGGGGGGSPFLNPGWAFYGSVIPGDPLYGFPDVKQADGTRYFPEPFTRDFLGLAAKGNVVIGNYTSAAFQNGPKVWLSDPTQAGSKTQPYVVDPTDVKLGYANDASGVGCGGRTPCFGGDYTQQDKDFNGPGGGYNGDGMGYKLNPDGSIAVDSSGTPIPRAFYESSVTDQKLDELIGAYYGSGQDALYDPAKNVAAIDGVFFTNHAIAAQHGSNVLEIRGAVVGRDDAIMFREGLIIKHDLRLMDGRAIDLNLPLNAIRPKLVGFRECAPSGC